MPSMVLLSRKTVTFHRVIGIPNALLSLRRFGEMGGSHFKIVVGQAEVEQGRFDETVGGPTTRTIKVVAEIDVSAMSFSVTVRAVGDECARATLNFGGLDINTGRLQ